MTMTTESFSIYSYVETVTMTEGENISNNSITVSERVIHMIAIHMMLCCFPSVQLPVSPMCRCLRLCDSCCDEPVSHAVIAGNQKLC